MKLAEFKQTFEEKGYDVERILEENLQDIHEELYYFNGGGFAKVSSQNKQGSLQEIFVYSYIRNLPSEKTIFKHLQRSECCREWYKESIDLGQDLSKEIYSYFEKEAKDRVILLVLRPDSLEANSFQELSEAVQFMIDNYEV